MSLDAFLAAWELVRRLGAWLREPDPTPELVESPEPEPSEPDSEPGSEPVAVPVFFSELAGMHVIHVCRTAGGGEDDVRNLLSRVCGEVQRVWSSTLPCPLHSVEVRSYDLVVEHSAPASEALSELRLGLVLLADDDGNGFRGLVFDPQEHVSVMQNLFRGKAFSDANEIRH